MSAYESPVTVLPFFSAMIFPDIERVTLYPFFTNLSLCVMALCFSVNARLAGSAAVGLEHYFQI